MSRAIAREKRSHPFQILMTPTERARLEEQAVARGTTISAMMRAALLSQPLPDRKSAIEVEAVAALNRVGANLNQIARAANSSGGLTAEQIKSLSGLYQHVVALARRIKDGAK